MTTRQPLTWNHLNEHVFEEADLSCFKGYVPVTEPVEDFDDNLPSWERAWSMIVAKERDPKVFEEILILGSNKLRFSRIRFVSPTEIAEITSGGQSASPKIENADN